MGGMNNVTLWGASWCSPCKQIKPKLVKYCEDSGYSFQYRDIEQDSAAATNRGITTVPTIEVHEAVFPAVNMQWSKIKDTIERLATEV